MEESSATVVLSHDGTAPPVNSRDGETTTGAWEESPSENGAGVRTMTTATSASSCTTTTTTSVSGPEISKDVQMLDAGNGSDESGYGSDSSPDTPNGGDLTDSGSSSSYDGYRVFGDEDDDDSASDDMKEKIYFLREKQHILERATSVLSRGPETCYAAAMASELCRGLTTESSSSGSSSSDEDGKKKKDDPKRGANIWSEARRVLSVINKRGSGGDESSGRSLPVPAQVCRKRCEPNPMNPLINTGIVHMVRSKQYESGDDDSDSDAGPVRALPGLPFTGSNQWLTKALLWSNSSSAASPTRSVPSQGNWSLTTDPFTHSYGLVPPSTMSLDDAVDLQDVINVSDEARVVTQSSPPFCVVHVNRAFLELADLPGHDTLVGKPVETMFRLSDFVDPNPKDQGEDGDEGECRQSRFVIGTVQVGKKGKSLSCRLRVLPVVDRSRRRRLSRVGGSCFQCMSHILIQVEALSDRVSHPPSANSSTKVGGSTIPAPLCHPSSSLHGPGVIG